MKHLSFVIGLLLLASCGARTPLYLDDGGVDGGSPPADSGIDAGRVDAGRRDAGRPDAGVDCLLEQVGDPIAVHEDRAGAFDSPNVHPRLGGLDAVAAFTTFTDDRTDDGRARFLSIDGGRLVAASESTPLTGVVPGARMPGTVASDLLVVCYPIGPLGALGGFEGRVYTRRFAERYARGSCAEAIGRGDSVALFTLDSAELVLTFVDTGGSPTSPPTRVDSDVTSVGATRTVDGIAFVAPGAAPGTASIGFIRDGTVDAVVEAVDTRLAPAAAEPVIAPWPFDDGDVVFAAHGPGRLELIVVDLNGTVRRRIDVGFTMFGDVTPALATDGVNLIAAQLNFGDLDPGGGLLEVFQIAPGGVAATPVTLPVERDFDGSAGGGVSATAIGSDFVIHYTTADRATGTTRTEAILLSCLAD